MLSGDPLHCVFPVAPPAGRRLLSVLSLPEGEKTPCVQSPLGGGGGGEDSVCTVPTGGGENSGCTVSGYIQSSSVQKCIYSRKSERSASGGQTKAVPSGVGKTWAPPVDHRAHKRRIQVALQGTPKPIQGTLHNQQLHRLRQTKCLMDLYSRTAAERHSQSRSYPRKSGILQPSFPGTKTRQPLEASHRLKFTKQIPGHSKVQDGDPGVHMCLPQEGGMGHIYNRSHRCLPTRTYSHPVSEVPRVSFQRRHLTVHQPPIRASNSPPHFHQYSQKGKTDSFAIRNQTPPIPGRLLIRAPSEQQCMVQTQKLLKLVKDLGFIVNLKKSELRPSQRFDFLGYHFLLDLALVKPTQDRWTKLKMFHRLSLKSVISARTLMSTIGLLASTEKTVKLGRMHRRPFQWHLKTHWKYPMPLDTPIPWNQRTRRTSPPQGTQKTDIYRRLKCRLGRSLRSKFYRSALVSFRKAPSHQPIRNEGGSSGYCNSSRQIAATIKSLSPQTTPQWWPISTNRAAQNQQNSVL